MSDERGLPKGWKRHNDYCIRKTGWYIAKCFVEGATLYVLHDEAGTRYGNFESAADAASYADQPDLGDDGVSTLRWTPEMLAAHTAKLGKAVAAAPTPVGSVTKPARTRKYGNKPTTDAEGVKHASKKQAARYRDLGLLMKSGKILMLAREVRFRLPGGVEYRADHITANRRAIEVMAGLVASGDLVVEDVKSPATRNDKLYKVKAKQMRECLGLEVREI